MEPDPNQTVDASRAAEGREVLRLEYNNSSAEYNEVLKAYRDQISLLNYYVTIFTGVLLFLFTTTRENSAFEGRQINIEYIFAIALTFSLALLYYIYSNAIDIVYNLYLVESKRAVLERRINDFIGASNLLNWDSSVVRHFNEDFIFERGWMNPSVITAVASGSLVIIITAIHCFLSFILVPSLDLKFYFTIGAGVISSFLLHQFVILHSTGKRYIFNYVYAHNSVRSEFRRPRFDVTYLPIFTLLVGPMAFILFSVKENAFWYTSDVDFPYIFIWTMSVGDIFFLPLINYKLGNLVLNLVSWAQIKKNKKLVVKWSVGLFVVAFVLSSVSHYAWVTDRYTDFIALVPGRITAGGVWHWAFTIAETFLFGFFFLIWFVAIKEENTNAVAYCRKLWWWIFLFSCLMIANFVQQYFSVYETSVLESLVSAKFTFIPLLFVVVLRIYLNRMWKVYERRLNLGKLRD